MPYKPDEVYLGVADIFVLLLPGAITVAGIAWLVNPQTVATFDGSLAQWASVVLASYVIGHLVSGVGAWTEDLLSNTAGARARLAGEAKDVRPTVRKRVRLILNREISEGQLRRMTAILVYVTSPELRSLLSRKDADRRFFRNLTIISGLVFASWCVARVLQLGVAAPGSQVLPAAALVFGLSLLRYRAQDAKYTRDVFDYFLVLDSVGGFASSAVTASTLVPPGPGSLGSRPDGTHQY